jgi:phosphate-selective porin OprO/OprP
MYNYPDFLSYQVGIFDGSRNNGSIDSDTNDAKEYQGRLFSHPFLHSGVSALEGLGLGVAGSWGRPNDDTLSTYQSPGLQNIFVYNSLARADGQQYRVYPQSYWIMGPFQLVGEYALSNQDIANQVTVDRLTQNKFSTNQNDQAWNVTASYVLTGETNTFLGQGIKPRHNFNPAEGNWGAFQVAARWSTINFDKNIFENVGTAEKPIYPFADPRVSVAAATTWGLSISWWLNPNVKLMTDYSQTSFQEGAGEFSSSGQLTPAILARETEKVWQTRMQLGF